MKTMLIAHNTYREATRDRVLAGMVGAGVAILLVAQLADATRARRRDPADRGSRA